MLGGGRDRGEVTVKGRERKGERGRGEGRERGRRRMGAGHVLSCRWEKWHGNVSVWGWGHVRSDINKKTVSHFSEEPAWPAFTLQWH